MGGADQRHVDPLLGELLGQVERAVGVAEQQQQIGLELGDPGGQPRDLADAEADRQRPVEHHLHAVARDQVEHRLADPAPAASSRTAIATSRLAGSRPRSRACSAASATIQVRYLPIVALTPNSWRRPRA